MSGGGEYGQRIIDTGNGNVYEIREEKAEKILESLEIGSWERLEMIVGEERAKEIAKSIAEDKRMQGQLRECLEIENMNEILDLKKSIDNYLRVGMD